MLCAMPGEGLWVMTRALSSRLPLSPRRQRKPAAESGLLRWGSGHGRGSRDNDAFDSGLLLCDFPGHGHGMSRLHVLLLSPHSSDHVAQEALARSTRLDRV